MRWFQWLKANSVMLVNAGSLVGTTAVTSGLGFIYWWIAAQHFPPEAIGIASACISAMMLLGSFCVMGLGTLLITELPRQPGHEASLISTALLVVGIVGTGIGLLFTVLAPLGIASFHILRATATDSLVFAFGVSLNAITLVLDQALIGLLRGSLQLWRNTLFAIIKLVTLFFVGTWLTHSLELSTGLALYALWALSSCLSVLVLMLPVVFKKRDLRQYVPRWNLLPKLGGAALQHHLLNLLLQFPTQVLPLLVTALLSARMNAWFYVSWMIVSFIFIIPGALTTVLHAMNSAQASTLAQKARVTIGLAFLTALATNLVLQFFAPQVLGIFGAQYARHAAWCLRILALAAFPLIIKNHYISICRIQDRISGAMLGILPGGILEVVVAIVGAHMAGLAGLSAGWVIAIGVEALYMSPTVYKAVWSGKELTSPDMQDSQEIQALWLVETSSMPAIMQSYPGIKVLQHIEKSLPGIATHAVEPFPSLATVASAHSGRLKPLRLERYE